MNSSDSSPPEQDQEAKLVGVLTSGEKVECLIDRDEVDIGTAAHNRLVLSDPTVSKTHAVIIARDGVYTIADLGSRNGTFVNGERLGEDARPLSHGDKIKLGQALLIFRNSAETVESRTAKLPVMLINEARKRAANREGPPTPNLPATVAVRSVPAEAAEPAAEEKGAEAPEEEKAEKKKRKKKEKDDERLRAAYINSLSRILAAVLSVVLTVGLTVFLVRSGSGPAPTAPAALDASRREPPRPRLGAPTARAPFRGGTFAASGVASVGGTDGVLFVDDGKPGEVLWMRVDPAGMQVGDVKPIRLGVAADDPEGITYGGSYFYVAGGNALVRFAFDVAGQRPHERADALGDVRGFLAANVPELKGGASKIDIEGVAWDPIQERLLLGLRSPLVDGEALVVPIRLRNPLGAFVAANLQTEPQAIRLPLGGAGIRDLQYDGRLKSFLVISGPAEPADEGEFKLWEWSGTSDGPPPQERATLDRAMKPEGITRVTVGGRDFILVVGDASSYARIDY